MSSNYSKICSRSLEDIFGQAVREVGEVLMKMGPMPLPRIFKAIKETKMPISKVKDCLKVLIQHNIVTFKLRPGFADPNYILDSDVIFQIMRFPQYFAIVEEELGTDAKAVIQELAYVGQASLTKLLFVMGSKFRNGESKPDEKAIREKLSVFYSAFKTLADNKYCIRCEEVNSDDEALVPTFQPLTSQEERLVPNLNLNYLLTEIMAEASVQDLQDNDLVIWKVDATTFHLEMKNQLLVDAMRRRLLTIGDDRVFKAMLKIGLRQDPYAISTPAVSVNEIKAELMKLADGPDIIRCLDQHLEMMEEDSLRLVVKISEANSGLYVVSVKTAFVQLMWTTVEELIIERHGFHAARIFRMIKRNKYVEQEKLNELCMIPAKDCKCLTYKLVEDNFVILKEIRKTYTASAAAANQKSSFVFYIDIIQCVRAITEYCYKAMLNARIRLTVEKENQKALLIKEGRVERTLAHIKKTNCTEEQLNDVRDTITPPEREVLALTHANISRLTAAILRADHTVFVIKIFLQYHKLKE